MKNKQSITIFFVATAVFGCLPFFFDIETTYYFYLLFIAFIYVALSQAWNIIGGITGQISLGQHAFFGLGAYVTAIAWLDAGMGYFHPLSLFLSGLCPAILAVLVGLPLLSKLRGIYFALGSLGVGEILRVMAIQGGELTGGALGLILPPSAYTSMKPYYYSALILAFLAMAVTYYMARSRTGLALVTIREDETAAAANGINVLKYKILAFAVSAFITGLCGSLHAYYLFVIHPRNFIGLSWTLYPVLMVALGGSGTIMGPLIGAFVLTALFEFVKIWLPNIHPVFSGTFIIFVMLFLPGGIISLFKSRKSPGGKKRRIPGTT